MYERWRFQGYVICLNFFSEFWVCYQVLGLFRIFHTHTSMLNDNPTLFCFRILGFLSSFGFDSNIPHTHLDAQRPPHHFLFPNFGFVSNIPRTHHDAQRPPHHFLFPSFGFVVEFWVCFQHSIHTPRCWTPTPQFFISEFWVCCWILGLFPTFHIHTMMLNAHRTIFCFQILGLLSSSHKR